MTGASPSFVALAFCYFLHQGGAEGSGGSCGVPAVALHSRVELSDEAATPGTVASYSCDPGYLLFGSATRVCRDNGRWTGDPPACGVNVALGKPATASSGAKGASRANDGLGGTLQEGRGEGGSCAVTGREPSPWWRVDLLGTYPVTAVRLTTPGCCGQSPLHDLEIRVGNQSTELQRNPLCAWFPATLEEGVTKDLVCARSVVGRYVFVQMVGVEASLSLCEVQVFTPSESSGEEGSCAGGEGFRGLCYEVSGEERGGSWDGARKHCARRGGDLAHAFPPPHLAFIVSRLERLKPKLKTQLVWIGAHKEPGILQRTWKWVNGESITKPAWGKDQPNSYNGEQNCVVLDGGSDWLWNDVRCNLDYLHWICQYKPVGCGSPDRLANTTVSEGSREEGSSLDYSCPRGHMLVGSPSRTCRSGSWSGRAPSCLYVDCGPVNTIEHGKVVLRDNRTTHGGVAEFSCDRNYTLVGERTRVCGDHGKWSGQQPQCLFDWCGEPPQGEGVLVEVSGRKTGSTASYTCKPGFVLFGQQVLTCGLGGEWSGKAPSCRYVDCREPGNIEHGRYTLLNGTTTHGSIAEYTCDQDHWLEPPTAQRITCLREGQWSQAPPSCQLITCKMPDYLKNGYVVYYDFNVHSSVEFHCEAGFVLKGQKVHTCTPSGEWDAQPPTCHFVDCGKVPPIPYGSVSYTNDTTFVGSEVVFSCSKNYRLIGPEVRFCQEDRTWSDTLPRCEEIRCKEPVLAEHAILSVTGNDRVYGRTLIKTADSGVSVSTYKIGALAKYRCERGYKIEGDPLSTCDTTGLWSGQVPKCVYVDCGMPEAPVHGSMTLASNATYYGAAVLYQCDDNFKLDGFARRLCLDNATWSASVPLCQEVRCGEAEKEGASVVQVSTQSVGGVAHYSCPKGYHSKGNVTRICLPTGIWSGLPPSCIPVDCEEPGSIENGRIIIVNSSTTLHSAVEYHCVPHYTRIGPYLRKCMHDGTWSGEEPRCELTVGPPGESQTLGLAIGIGAGIVLFLLIILAIIYLRIRKETPVKNTENIQGALRKEDQSAAVMSYANLNDATTGNNIYENIHEEMTYDSPYEETSHYEPSPVSRRSSQRGVTPATVTINGVAVR